MSAVPQTTPFRAVFGRLAWMLVGPLILFVVTLSLFKKRDSFWDPSDLGYFVCLFAIVVGQWIEFRSGSGLTADGEPVNARQVRRFTVAATVLGLAVWTAVTLFRVFVLTG
jgi:hypothetical protein